MKAYRVILPSLLAVLLFAGADISCSKKGADKKQAGYYTCSMHPQVIEQKPGNCPICGMKLTFIPLNEPGKKKNIDHSKTMDEKKGTEGKKNDKMSGMDMSTKENFTFSIAENLIQNARIYTVPAREEAFSSDRSFSGHIDYDESPARLVIVNTKYDGWIERLYVSKEGQTVRRGASLIGVYSPKLLAAKEEYVATLRSIRSMYLAQGKSEKEALHDSTVSASRRKLVNLDVPASEIRGIEKNLRAGRITYYRAPISGIIIKKNVLQGSHIKAGQELFRIANLSRLWIFIHIFEKDIPFVKKGERVTIKTESYPDRKLTGRIDLIYPFLDMKTRDIKVRIEVANRGMLLKPGMYVNVDVASRLRGKVITIPDIAVIYSGKKSYVFVSRGEGKFETRPVVVRVRSEGKAVIAKGLKKNELVVANGQFLLDSEASLKAAMQKGGMVGHNH